MKKILDSEIQEIIRLYQLGKAPKEIGKQFGIFNNSVTRILRKHGVDRNQLIKVSQEQVNTIIENYVSGISSEIIAANLGLNGTTVCRILQKNNIIIRPATENKRKYKISQDYFEIIDSQEKAYFLGLFYADGSLAETGFGIKITLHEKDRDILEKLSNIIYGFHKLKESNAILEDGSIANYLTVNIYSKKMHQDLTRHGCMHNKTFKIRFPQEKICSELLWHFVRGYFDGDGCISITDISKPVVDFTSNLEFIKGVSKFLTNNNIKCNKIEVNAKNPLIAKVQLTAINNIANFYSELYRNANLYMNRKYDLYQQFFEKRKTFKINQNLKYQDIAKYGTIYIPQFNGKLLNSNNLSTFSEEEKLQIINYLFDFYRENGFPYTILTDDELISDFNSLKNLDVNNIIDDHVLKPYNMSGTLVFKHFNNHFYEVNGQGLNRLSMLNAFNNDILLKEVIKNRIKSNFNMTGNMLKQGLANSKLAYKASIFNPGIAKFIYNTYAKEGDIIYDYSMGFGQRLLAALSLPFKIKYIGVDVWDKSVESNRKILEFFNKNIPSFNRDATILNIGSEKYCDPEMVGKVNMAFSSPPYYNLEQYEDNPKQAYNGGYNNFINQWWRETTSNIDKLLVDNGLFIININDKIDKFNIGEDMCNIIKEKGYTLLDTYHIKLNRNLVFGKKEDKLEGIYIFKRR